VLEWELQNITVQARGDQMHAQPLLHKFIDKVMPSMHSSRCDAVKIVVGTVINGGDLAVTALGRAMKSDAMEKHCIKRVDRLMSNKHLISERLAVYGCLSHQILGAVKRPLILVDWSDLNEREKLFLLRASTPVGGRSLTLYEEVHDISTKEKRSTHKQFLATLSEMLPEGCQPIIVTDAGFKTPWFQQVEELGWDWVGRVRGATYVRFFDKKTWESCKSFYELAAGKPKSLGRGLLAKSKSHECSLVVYKGKRKGRIKKNLDGRRCRAIRSKKHAQREKEPWFLATSLKGGSQLASRTVKIYKTRMQIEEEFRDLKSARYGMSLEHSATYKPERLEILLLIGSLAHTMFWIIGKASEVAGLHRQYQANTIRNRTVLSTVFLGQQVANDNRTKFTLTQFWDALKSLVVTVEHYAFGY
jgi:hypothetical protein